MECYMSTMEPLCLLLNVNHKIFTKKEHLILEAVLFIRICDELKKIYRTIYKDYFHIMKFNIDKENAMLEKSLIQFTINDILSTEEYTAAGIAHYTNIHIDIIQEFASGLNTKPLAIYLRKIIELHRLVRPDFYQRISKKIINELIKLKPLVPIDP